MLDRFSMSRLSIDVGLMLDRCSEHVRYMFDNFLVDQDTNGRRCQEVYSVEALDDTSGPIRTPYAKEN